MSSRVPFITVLFAAFLGLFVSHAAAQTGTHASVRVGDVTGIELGLEGVLVATPGSRFRAFATVYEVVGVSDLRPAANAEIFASTSASGSTPVRFSADASGRVLLDVPVPADAQGTLRIALDARHLDRIRRRFDLSVQLTPNVTLSVLPLPPAGVVAGSAVPVIARLAAAGTGVPVAGERLTFSLRAGEPLAVAEEVSVVTSSEGLAIASLTVPEGATAASIEVSRVVDGARESLHQLGVPVVASSPRAPYGYLSVADSLVGPGTTTRVVLAARTARGLPIAGARVTLHLAGHTPMQDLTTDENGRLEAPWSIADFGPETQDLQVIAQLQHPAHGSFNIYAQVRYAQRRAAFALVPHGGALSPTTNNRVYVVAQDMHGRPLEAAGIRVSVPSLGVCRTALDSARGYVYAGRLSPGSTCPALVGELAECAVGAAALVEVDGDALSRASFCLPVDDAQTLTVFAENAASLGRDMLAISLDRAPSVRGMPVVVYVSQRGRALAQAVIAPNASGVRIDLAEASPQAFDRSLAVDIVARPIASREGVEVHGGTTSLFLASTSPSARPAVSLRFRVDTPYDFAEWAFAFDRARGLDDREVALLKQGRADVVANAHAPRDYDAPARLRDGRIVFLPSPEGDSRMLRDAWRTRARFVEGRLGSVLRDVEQAVEAALPNRLDELTVRSARGREFSELLLDAIPSLQQGADRGARSLAGEALTFSSLRAIDPEFNFDNVARRLTRKRLFSLMLSLRDFVLANALDLPWTIQGDPAEWLASLPNSPGLRSFPISDARQLVDAWGRPFALRRVTRPRFDRIVPVAGYELVSAGPDGTFGNADDVFDPTAPVLVRDGVYARAVGERALVARLRSVELGRATVLLLDGAPVPVFEERSSSSRGDLLATLPEPRLYGEAFAARPAELPQVTPRRGDLALASSPSEVTAPSLVGTLDLAFDEGGGFVVTPRSLTREGGNIHVVFEPPTRLREGEPALATASLFPIDRRAHRLAVTVAAEGAAAEVASVIDVAASGVTSLPVRIDRATGERGTLRLELRDEGRLTYALRTAMTVSRGDHAASATAFGGPGAKRWEGVLTLPEGVRDAQASLMLLRADRAADDPGLADARRRYPGLFGWATARQGRELDAATRAAILKDAGTSPPLSQLGALVALSTLGPDDAAAEPLRAALLSRFESGALDEQTAASTARSLALLSFEATDGVQDDAFSARARDLRRRLRASLLDGRETSFTQAEIAAALLLVDPRDGHGRAFYARLVASLDETDHLPVPEGERRGSRADTASLFALSLAAHQLGDIDARSRFARLGLRDVTHPRELEDAALFWYLASSVHGALGTPVEGASLVVAGGEETLSWGEASYVERPLAATNGARVALEVADGVLARVEARYFRSLGASNDGPVSVSLVGDSGGAGRSAALELELAARIAVDDLVVEFALPAPAEADELVSQLRESGALERIEERSGGVLRMRVRALANGETVRIPLSWRWLASGTARGASAVAYSASRPELRTVLEERAFVIGE